MSASTNTLASAPAADARVADMAMMIRLLALALRRVKPDHDLPSRAMAYLERVGMLGSPLRVNSPQDLRPAGAGLAEVSRAWNALPEDLRTDPALRSLAKAIGGCAQAEADELQVDKLRVPLARLVAFQRQYATNTGEAMPGNEHYASLLMGIVREARAAIGADEGAAC